MSAIPNTLIRQYGDLAAKPHQVYGQGESMLRIGNGGAGTHQLQLYRLAEEFCTNDTLGGTGLVEALARDYIALNNISGAIEWVCNHSRNTQLALLSGHIDIALTYEREQEEIAVSEGWAENAGCIFHDHFCLVGPEHDPANVKSAQSIEEAFDRIATTQSMFHSRDDGSATAHKDHEIWRRCHRSPWTDSANSWFVKTKFNPADAIINATKSDAYILNDRSTLLNQVRLGKITKCTVYLEPTNPFHPLMNSCYALHAPSLANHPKKHIRSFLEYLKSPRGQKVIEEYGKDTVGTPYFAPEKSGIVSQGLVGGRPRNCKWLIVRQSSSKL